MSSGFLISSYSEVSRLWKPWGHQLRKLPMTLHQRQAETMQQAEKTMADLEAFLDLMQASTLKVRARELHWLPALRWAIATATESHSYTMDHFGRFEAACRLLARSRPPAGFSESETISEAIREAMRIREVLHEMGLVKHRTRTRTWRHFYAL